MNCRHHATTALSSVAISVTVTSATLSDEPKGQKTLPMAPSTLDRFSTTGRFGDESGVEGSSSGGCVASLLFGRISGNKSVRGLTAVARVSFISSSVLLKAFDTALAEVCVGKCIARTFVICRIASCMVSSSGTKLGNYM